MKETLFDRIQRELLFANTMDEVKRLFTEAVQATKKQELTRLQMLQVHRRAQARRETIARASSNKN